jgi:hypothetical protein
MNHATTIEVKRPRVRSRSALVPAFEYGVAPAGLRDAGSHERIDNQ